MPPEAPSTPAPNHVPALLLALVLAIAAYVQFAVVSRTVVASPLRADAGEYFNYAYNLHHYGVYSLRRTWDITPAPPAPAPDKIRSPGYPLFLLAAGEPQPLEGYGHRVVLLQAVLGVLGVWLVYLIAAAALDRRWALVAAALAATTPQLATINTYLLTEGPFTFFLLAATWATIRAAQSRHMWWFIASGALWGIASLVRPTTLLLPPLLLGLVLVFPAWRPVLGRCVVALAAFLLVLSPWFIRNLSVPDGSHRTNVMVNSIAHGSYPGFMYEGRPETFGYPYRADPQLNEITRDLPTVVGAIAARAAERPGLYATWYLLGKPFYFLSLRDVQSADIMIYPTERTPFYEDLHFAMMRMASRLLHWPLMLGALCAMALLGFRRRLLRLGVASPQLVASGLVGIVVAYAIAFHMIVAPFPRYAIPFRPLLFVLALLAVRAAWLRWGLARE
jgi:4-amino-4-deoxy-L-arabinose transferase-like glycosyltransferase